MKNNNLEIKDNIELNNKSKVSKVVVIILIIIFVIICAIGITLFISKSYDGSKSGNIYSPFINNTKDIDTNNNDSNYTNDLSEEDLKYLYEFLNNEYLSDKYDGINIFSIPDVRVRYVTFILQSSNKAQVTTDDQNATGQQLLYASVTDFTQAFKETFGENYNLENSLASISNYSIYNLCTGKPSVNDGQHVCWIGISTSSDSLVATIINKTSINGIYVVKGKYKKGYEIGSYELKYTVSNNSLFINSVTLTKN